MDFKIKVSCNKEKYEFNYGSSTVRFWINEYHSDQTFPSVSFVYYIDDEKPKTMSVVIVRKDVVCSIVNAIIEKFNIITEMTHSVIEHSYAEFNKMEIVQHANNSDCKENSNKYKVF